METQALTATIDRSLGIASAIAVSVFMFLPLIAVSIYISDPSEALSGGTMEATVGVGVILRAIARRLFRAGARNIIRVTFGTMTRAVARTATTRVIRVFIRSVAGSTVKDLTDDDSIDNQEVHRVSVLAILMGTIGTALSFWGVLVFADATSVLAFQSESQMTLISMLTWAVVPLICLSALCVLVGMIFGARAYFSTGIDGLMIQAYFTVSGSFLPMTTDFEFRGARRACALSSFTSLTLMLAIFAIVRFVGAQSDSSMLIFASAMFLTYAFVYAFPVNPLLGYSIWIYSKWLWLCIFIPILLAFLLAFPNALAALL